LATSSDACVHIRSESSLARMWDSSALRMGPFSPSGSRFHSLDLTCFVQLLPTTFFATINARSRTSCRSRRVDEREESEARVVSWTYDARIERVSLRTSGTSF
jgi:hypothetical protein